MKDSTWSQRPFIDAVERADSSRMDREIGGEKSIAGMERRDEEGWEEPEKTHETRWEPERAAKGCGHPIE